MITRIRDVRRAKGLTLEDVAKRCVPPTTAQTIGRLETGTRTVSVDWLNRIAAALETTAQELVEMEGQEKIPVAALLGSNGVTAPTHPLSFLGPTIEPRMMGIKVRSSAGDYRTGDDIWCTRLRPDQFTDALHRDVLVPTTAGRFQFGRLIDLQEDRIAVMPLDSGKAASTLPRPPWLAVVTRLIRTL